MRFHRRSLRAPLVATTLALVALVAVVALFAMAAWPYQPVLTSNPVVRFALARAESLVVRGRIVARVGAGSYAYLRVQPEGGDAVWLATLASTAPAVGDAAVELSVVGRAERFHSPRLGRDFAPLLFGFPRDLAR
jgi:membrane protein implicated in regulation of membrane protease activity